MAEPKKQSTKSRGKVRRGSKASQLLKLVKCSHCNKKKKAHQICPHCGYYQGQKIEGV